MVSSIILGVSATVIGRDCEYVILIIFVLIHY